MTTTDPVHRGGFVPAGQEVVQLSGAVSLCFETGIINRTVFALGRVDRLLLASSPLGSCVLALLGPV